MDDVRFAAVIRRLGFRVTRRGVVGVLAGLTGLGLNDAFGRAHKNHKQGKRKQEKKRRVGVEITDGTLDHNGHPYVGLMSAQDANGHLWRCSGTLISPTVFLTAGHCTEAPADRARVWFDADVDAGIPGNGYPNTGGIKGTIYTHPQYDPNAFWLYDLGVVVLDTPVVTNTYGTLPTENALNALVKKRGQKDLTFTAVGYGLRKAFPDAAAWREEARRVRMVATPRLIQINTGYTGDSSIVLSHNANTGGTCFGDSGGPNFIGNSNVIGGVTSFGNNSTRAGTGGVYRVDKADDLNWLSAEFGVQ